MISFTGSAETAIKLQSHPTVAREAVRFISERDSLNATVLGPDAAPGTPEFDLFRARDRARDDDQGRAEMHRHPPRLRARRVHGRGAGGAGGTAGEGGGGRSGGGRRDDGRFGVGLPTRGRARQGGGVGGRIRARVRAIRCTLARAARTPTAVSSSARSCFGRTARGTRSSSTTMEPFGPGGDAHALPRLRRCRRARQPGRREPRLVVVHARSRRRARFRDWGGRLPWPYGHRRPRQRGRIDRPRFAAPPTRSTVGRGARGVARRWAASAASSIICSAPRSRVRPRC